MNGICEGMSPAKTAEPIDMPFGLRTWVFPWNHVLDRSPYPAMGRGNFEGKGASHSKVQRHSAVICACAKMAEPIEMPFEL